MLLGNEFSQSLAQARSRVSGHMWRLGSENPFVAALDLAGMSVALEDPQVPMLLLAALDVHEARMQPLPATTEALVSECTLALRNTVRHMLSAWNPEGSFVARPAKANACNRTPGSGSRTSRATSMSSQRHTS